MRIIPVIDLMDGHVVHAHGGERSRYQPLVSTLCRSSQPVVVVAALRKLHPFHTLYVADLDAIRNTGDNLSGILTIHRRFPALHVWLDNGIRSVAAVRRCLNLGFASPVIGSETLADLDLLRTLKATAVERHCILSLDYLGNRFLGPKTVETCPDLWPGRVILMTLSRVGSRLGPALDQLRQLRQRSPRTELYAAGGIRDRKDLVLVRTIGVTGALVASGLHDGCLTSKILARYRSAKLETDGETRTAQRCRYGIWGGSAPCVNKNRRLS